MKSLRCFAIGLKISFWPDALFDQETFTVFAVDFAATPPPPA